MYTTQIEPTYPGEMLLEEFLIPMGISHRELVNGVSWAGSCNKWVKIIFGFTIF